MKYQICTKTVLDTTYPNITFDHEGICNHYYEYHNKVKKNIKNEIDGNIEFKKIASQVKKSRGNSEFDCILGLSGGLDSSFMLHKIVTEYDLKPLVFHVDGGWNSEISTNNIYNMVDKLGLELFTEVINWNEMREFQLSFFKSGVPHLDIPQDHAFISVLYNFAEKYNIKYILNGGNISTEAVIMPYKYYYWGTDLKQIHDITSKYCSIDLKEYPFSSVFRHKLYLKYFKGVKVIKPLNYFHYKKDHAIKILSEKYNWKSYKQKHFESRFTQFYEGYWLPKRFNFDVRRCQFTSLILNNQMTRIEALEILKTPPIDDDKLKKEIDFVCNKLQISIEELSIFESLPKKFYWDYKNNHFLLKSIEIILSFLNAGRRGGAF